MCAARCVSITIVGLEEQRDQQVICKKRDVGELRGCCLGASSAGGEVYALWAHVIWGMRKGGEAYGLR